MAFLTDTSSHAPPVTGSYPYSPPGNWLPGQTGFVGLGQTYIDPVFGTPIRRISNNFPTTGDYDLWAKNGNWNADGTRILMTPSLKAVDTTTGAVVRTGIPRGGEPSFDPNFPDVYYYASGTTLKKFLLSTGTSITVKDFGVDISGGLGASVDPIDGTGRYFVRNINGNARVWDAIDINGRLPGDPAYVPQNSGLGLATPGDAGHGGLFNGSFPANFGSGYIGITPSADGVFMTTTTVFWYPLNLSTKTMDSSGISRTPDWYGGDHADVVSASDGNSYIISLKVGTPDLAVARWNLTVGGASTILLHVGNNVLNWHLSGIPRGVLRDWMTVDLEYGASGNADLSAWEPFHQEIFLVNVLTPNTVRRYAHHRSQDTGGAYTWEPRVSVNWDGTKIAYDSNYGYSLNEYADMYIIELSGTVPTVNPTPTPMPTRTPTPIPNRTPTPSLTGVPIPSSTPSVKSGDANGDGKIDEADYDIWLAHFGQTVNGGSVVGDFDGNGTVDGVDYVIWLNNYGK